VDFSLLTADSAKRNHKTWASHNTFREGIAIKTLEYPEIFQTLFPGFPDSMRMDTQLWKKYFSSSFNAGIHSSLLENRVDSLWQAYLSWTGCFDIYGKHGADVLVFGHLTYTGA